jgi:hypothetical protein
MSTALQGLPRGGDAKADVVAGAANLHQHGTHTCYEETTGLFADATTLHAPVHVFDRRPSVGERLIGRLLLRRTCVTTRFAGWRLDRVPFQRTTQEVQVLE